MSTTPAPNDLDTLKALEQAATPAPWKADTHTRGDCVLWGPDGQFVANAQAEPHWLPAADGGKRAVMFDVDRRDAALIEAMRNALPALLDELATERRQGAAMASITGEAIRQISEERDAAREELAKTRAELDEADAALRRLGDQANHLVQRLDATGMVRQRIADAHHKHVDGHGGTWGECNECGNSWPCPTYTWATTNRDPLATWDPADDDPTQPQAEANPATTAEPAAPKADACNGNCIHHHGEVVIEDLCCPRHGVDAEPAAS